MGKPQPGGHGGDTGRGACACVSSQRRKDVPSPRLAPQALRMRAQEARPLPTWPERISAPMARWPADGLMSGTSPRAGGCLGHSAILLWSWVRTHPPAQSQNLGRNARGPKGLRPSVIHNAPFCAADPIEEPTTEFCDAGDPEVGLPRSGGTQLHGAVGDQLRAVRLKNGHLD